MTLDGGYLLRRTVRTKGGLPAPSPKSSHEAAQSRRLLIPKAALLSWAAAKCNK